MQDKIVYAENEYTKEAEINKSKNYRKKQIALSGSMVAFGAAVMGYMLFDFIGGLSFVLFVFGVMWFIQIQLETAIDTIEIRVQKE